MLSYDIKRISRENRLRPDPHRTSRPVPNVAVRRESTSHRLYDSISSEPFVHIIFEMIMIPPPLSDNVTLLGQGDQTLPLAPGSDPDLGLLVQLWCDGRSPTGGVCHSELNDPQAGLWGIPGKPSEEQKHGLLQCQCRGTSGALPGRLRSLICSDRWFSST